MHRLRAAALVNDAAIGALAAFERHIPEVDALDAWRAPAVVAERYLTPFLVEYLDTQVAALMEDARASLVRIDERFASLSANVPKRLAPVGSENPANSERDRASARPSPTAPSARVPAALAGVFAGGATWLEQATQAAQELTTATAIRAREWIGVHTGLREAAQAEVQRHWIGPVDGADRPYLAEIDAAIDILADQARTLLDGQSG